VLGVSGGDEFCLGEWCGDGLHMPGRAQRDVGRGGVHAVRSGDVQKRGGVGAVLDVSGGNELCIGE